MNVNDYQITAYLCGILTGYCVYLLVDWFTERIHRLLERRMEEVDQWRD